MDLGFFCWQQDWGILWQKWGGATRLRLVGFGMAALRYCCHTEHSKNLRKKPSGKSLAVTEDKRLVWNKIKQGVGGGNGLLLFKSKGWGKIYVSHNLQAIDFKMNFCAAGI